MPTEQRQGGGGRGGKRENEEFVTFNHGVYHLEVGGIEEKADVDLEHVTRYTAAAGVCASVVMMAAAAAATCLPLVVGRVTESPK